ncbi:FUSC family protein [Streptomyces murinus]|uniref:FUSC family protein n=1 Tax=Streptomyces murinus TaxID=33900 RepID=UPI0037284346
MDRGVAALRGIRDRVVGSDPGLNRLRMALSAALAMATTLGIEYLYATATHAGPQGTLIAMLLGTVMAMMGSMALSGTGAWPKVRTAVFFPLAIGIGMLAGVAVAGRTDLMLCVFVAVMFVAVFVRRFGMAFFFYGFMIWMGYFFAAFLGAKLSMLPALLSAVGVATGWVLLLSLTVLRTNPRRTLRRVREAFGARARAVARASAELLAADPRRHARLRRRLHARQLRLSEAALMIEGWSAEPGALPAGWSGPALRRRLLEAHLAIDALAAAAETLAEDGGELLPAAARIAGHLGRREYGAVEYVARPLLEPRTGTAAPGTGRWPAHHLAAAAVEYVTLAGTAAAPLPYDDITDEAYDPVVTLAQGNLPGSAAVASDVAARGSHWNPLSRLTLTTRQAIQVAVAGTLAILAGRELSQARYYWAVLAAFIAFAGTATRSETSIKAVNRVVGTLVGLGAGIGLAHLTAGHTGWVLVVIVTSMSLGFYLVNVSYACMIFFVTIMVSQLYSVLHEFSAGLLLLRLEETALGAAIGIAVAYFILPTSTRDTVESARRAYFRALADLLDRAAPTRPDGTGLDALARSLDHRLQQLTLVARPLTRPMTWGVNSRLVRHRLTLYAATTRQARALVRSGFPVPPELADTCTALSRTATALAESTPRPDHPVPGVTQALTTAGTTLLTHRPHCPGTPLPPVTQPLVHLRQLLTELAMLPPTPTTPQIPAPTNQPTKSPR